MARWCLHQHQGCEWQVVHQLPQHKQRAGKGRVVWQAFLRGGAAFGHGCQAVEQALGSIATATAEQSTASQEIVRNIERIHEMTQSSDVSVRETQNQTQQLRQLAQDLRVLMDRFRV